MTEPIEPTTLTGLFRASGYPFLAVETAEETRFLDDLIPEMPEEAPVLLIANKGGLRNGRTGDTLAENAMVPVAIDRLLEVAKSGVRPVLVILDHQHFIRQPGIYRVLLNAKAQLEIAGATVILVAPSWDLPHELRHEMPVLPWQLPDRPTLGRLLDDVLRSLETSAFEVEEVDAEHRASLLDAAAGLSVSEAKNAFFMASASTRHTRLDADVVRAEKVRLIRNSGRLEVHEPVPMEHVGGLTKLKDYLTSEVVPHAHDPHLKVRGLLTVGLPGTGKSLAAKAAGAALQWPVVRLDIGAQKGSLVGQSEQNMRAALAIAEAVSPCVLWIDELEKGVGGYASSAQTDGGTTLGMVGYLLTWLQEHEKPIFTIATCNDAKALPPELVRAGRFDEKFFVDLPTSTSRKEIATIHLARLHVPHDPEDDLASQIAQLTPNFTGAEIEQVIKSAARRKEQPELVAEDIERAVARTTPFHEIDPETVAKIREWGKHVQPAEEPEKFTVAEGRKVS